MCTVCMRACDMHTIYVLIADVKVSTNNRISLNRTVRHFPNFISIVHSCDNASSFGDVVEYETVNRPYNTYRTSKKH